MKILIVSDIHANWAALQSVLEAEPGVRRILCLGDFVDFGPQPAECVGWAKENLLPEWTIQGNHDRAIALNEDAHCSPVYAMLTKGTQPISERVLTPQQRRFLAELQPLRRIELDEAKCVACHAIPKDPLYGYLSRTAAGPLWESEAIAAGEPDFLFVGHTHLPMEIRVKNTVVINPGSVGLPQDGDPRAAYAVWQDGKVTLRRVEYDVEQTIRGYEGLAVPQPALKKLTEALRTGQALASESVNA